jgi:hypothetical protein
MHRHGVLCKAIAILSRLYRRYTESRRTAEYRGLRSSFVAIWYEVR